ncbi:MAG: DUF2865 domain-containing protein [Filomicrobium sp.]
MRLNLQVCFTAAIAVLVLGLCASHVQAQSLLQSLFGNIFKSAPAKTKPRAQPPISHGLPTRTERAALPLDFGHHAYNNRRIRRSGYYRAYCVRTCDGYYFPVSNSASRSGFRKAAQECQRRCRGSKLYYLPKHSTEVENMVDMKGRRYEKSPNAFVYRKTLIDGCSCRPMPWSAAERARHNRYAYRDEVMKIAAERERRLKEQRVARSEGWNSVKQAVADSNPSDKSSQVNNSVAASGQQSLVEPSNQTASQETVDSNTPINAISGSDASYLPANATEQAKPAAYLASSSNSRRLDKKRKQRQRRAKARRKSKKAAANSGWSFGSSNKYSWPGDR